MPLSPYLSQQKTSIYFFQYFIQCELIIFWYTFLHLNNQSYHPSDCGVFAATSVDEWMLILTLALHWNFQSIKNLAINRLSSITSPVEQIMLGRRFNILEWLGNAYTQVCWQNGALTIKKGKLLGVKDVVKITAIHQGKNKSAFTTGSHTGILRKVFELPGWGSSTSDVDDKPWQDGPKGHGVTGEKGGQGKNRREFQCML